MGRTRRGLAGRRAGRDRRADRARGLARRSRPSPGGDRAASAARRRGVQRGVPEHHLRLWYTLADLCERSGDLPAARAVRPRAAPRHVLRRRRRAPRRPELTRSQPRLLHRGRCRTPSLSFERLPPNVRNARHAPMKEASRAQIPVEQIRVEQIPVDQVRVVRFRIHFHAAQPRGHPGRGVEPPRRSSAPVGGGARPAPGDDPSRARDVVDPGRGLEPAELGRSPRARHRDRGGRPCSPAVLPRRGRHRVAGRGSRPTWWPGPATVGA